MMTTWISWLPLGAAILAIGAAVGALAVAGTLPLLGRLLSRLEPADRFRSVMLLLAAPAIVAAMLLAIAFAPSALDAAGLLTDHCHYHIDHAFHLCFLHGAAPTDLWPLALLLPFVVAFARAVSSETAAVTAASRWSRKLRSVARYDDDLDCWLLDADGVALTVGTLRPDIFTSANLREDLGEDQWKALLAHEREHQRRRDGLMKSVARVLAALHLPATRRELLAQLEVASEQACDESAASVVGSREDVASAIVAMARRQRSPFPGVRAEAFGAHPVEQRVRGLLDPRWIRLPAGILSAVVIGSVVAVGLAYERLHHSFETALTHLF